MSTLQDNLWSVEKMTEFYNNNKTLIDSAMKSIVFSKGPYYGDSNYKGMLTSDGKPHQLNAARIYLINNRKIYEVFEKYKNRAEIKNLRETYPIAETMISGFIWVESRFDNRANLVSPNSNSSAKGLLQIIKKFTAGYPDFYNNVANFDDIPTTTPFGLEPQNSIYNAWSSIERSIVYINQYTPIYKTLAGNLKSTDRKYPVAGWMVYLYWNQGPRGAKIIYEQYKNNPDSLISKLPKRIYKNVKNNPFGGKRGVGTIGDWVERLRANYNVGQYLACNNCIARAFKSEIEKEGGVVTGDIIKRTETITCTPLRKDQYKIPIGALVKR